MAAVWSAAYVLPTPVKEAAASVVEAPLSVDVTLTVTAVVRDWKLLVRVKSCERGTDEPWGTVTVVADGTSRLTLTPHLPPIRGEVDVEAADSAAPVPVLTEAEDFRDSVSTPMVGKAQLVADVKVSVTTELGTAGELSVAGRSESTPSKAQMVESELNCTQLLIVALAPAATVLSSTMTTFEPRVAATPEVGEAGVAVADRMTGGRSGIVIGSRVVISLGPAAFLARMET
jgi:hypothetical protein